MSSVMRASSSCRGRPPGSRDRVGSAAPSFSICAASVIGSAMLPSTPRWQWDSRRSAEQTVDNLQRAFLAVTAVATLGERAAASFQVARSTRRTAPASPWVEVTLGQRGLDRGLTLQQPVECMRKVRPHRPRRGRAVRRGSMRRWRATAHGRRRAWMRVEDATDQRASTRSRLRSSPEPRMRSRPMLRAVPSAAATWPCGKLRMMVEGLTLAEMTVPPFNHRAALRCGLSASRTGWTECAYGPGRLRGSSRAEGSPGVSSDWNGFDAHGEASAHPVAAYMAHMILHGYDFHATSRLSESFQQLQRESAGKLGLVNHIGRGGGVSRLTTIVPCYQKDASD